MSPAFDKSLFFSKSEQELNTLRKQNDSQKKRTVIMLDNGSMLQTTENQSTENEF